MPSFHFHLGPILMFFISPNPSATHHSLASPSSSNRPSGGSMSWLKLFAASASALSAGARGASARGVSAAAHFGLM
ncbi:uncharacterized protein MYCGRDRAFT_79746 [Zymoseptoria tritici IPO323]|uniref:Uncharacterized protein n=1 Tax=Zymoseptoria tritici (strain CBS 115943 / IPO323) TaxID=336722 RepID=F9X5C9_ZYMTI|nr:uncharacterized protein MYCGRDRAFT_79746 [Zymoseptoria tritici IPO323]EGP88595.1 hypothetical protein MYCGRDRAFT_79746 [Zymoseptoria tritici IPO323]